MYKIVGGVIIVILLSACEVFKKKFTSKDKISISSNLEEVKLLNATKYDSLSKNLQENTFYWLRDSSITVVEGDNIILTKDGDLAMTKGKIIRKELKNINDIKESNSKIELISEDNSKVEVTKKQKDDLGKISSTVQSEVKTKNIVWVVISVIIIFAAIFFSLKRFVKF